MLDYTELPNGWQIKTLSEVCAPSSSNIAFKDVKDKKGDYPIYGASGIVAYSDFYSKEKECIGIVKDGSVGKIFILPAKSSVISTLNYLENFDDLNIKYLYYFLHCINFKKYIKGSVIPHIYFRDYKKEKIPLPPLATQKQIAERLDFLFDKIDKALKLLNENKEYIKKYRLSILKDAFEGKLTRPSKNWEQSTFEECLQYEQPTKYIVKSTKYNNNYKTPVLTAGKSFILGYTNETDGIFTQTPVIIFDDFTTDTKFVDFHFKVKSSAMKILMPNGKADIKFLYYLMQIIYHRSDTHKRYWISEYSKIKITIPPLEIQKEIVSILDTKFKSMEEIERLNNENIENLLLLKKSLLKEAFSGN